MPPDAEPRETEIDLPDPDWDDVLRDLDALSKNHLLYFRIEVGRSLAERFYAGDVKVYLAKIDEREGSLRRFCKEREKQLEDRGLSEAIVRQCLTAWLVVQELPPEVVRNLLFTHVVQLGRVGDTQTRRTLAQAVVDNRWDGQALKQAVLAVRAGKWIDADPKAEGFQPPAPTPKPSGEDKAPQPGRVVNRFEKTAEEIEALAGQWESVAVEKLTKLQKERVRDAIGKTEETISRLKARLGDGG